MPLDITITLSDEDLRKFQDSVDKGIVLVADEKSAAEIEETACLMIGKAREMELPQFISDRLFKLEILLNMIRDKECSLSKEECDSVRSALYYFVDPDDVIPDHIPGIGFLDDAMYAEIVIQELKVEIKMYQEFCQFRIAEENRRRNRGEDPYVGREDWIEEKRTVLHDRMRERRTLRTGGRGWRMRLI
ncbi:MAG: DUF1232 domain-containing protein [Gammaproteobacteria bacterium]|jgi:uncharacterized membrane protein YkvA (DUF1232 family)|nr:DUF1232 domain-containing protein [Gammaproteobacteria bacterium]MBT3859611.1 DUF1232 domain-containing protein [Gammaproteobacteria bacterium]MBT3986495.1 DUF1232 domain-containing protein [Gammaproteobacteria bacterium]MBT4255955.1 DUF1232 domain-containing protein [Gammaproteobacteria bacterium]MBT4582182.1 DUF1232 domain-containing protein [Gammaproteobacteria bacterium]